MKTKGQTTPPIAWAGSDYKLAQQRKEKKERNAKRPKR